MWMILMRHPCTIGCDRNQWRVGDAVFSLRVPARRGQDRGQPAISSFRIDQNSGSLTLLGTVAAEDAPTFLAPDRTGRYLLSAYYQGGYAAVHPLGTDSAVGARPLDRHETATGAHAISTDPSNRFAFVPHIAR